jgi:hypothetical protein
MPSYWQKKAHRHHHHHHLLASREIFSAYDAWIGPGAADLAERLAGRVRAGSEGLANIRM